MQITLFRIQDIGYKLQKKDTDTGHKVLFLGYRIQDTMYHLLGSGYRIQIKDTDTVHKVLFFRIQDKE